MDITAAELRALLALGKLSRGQDAFLNVIDADLLVDRKLAERIGKGQFILTEEGLALLARLESRLPPDSGSNK